MNLLFETGITKDAIISECGRYRYTLTRIWGDGKLVNFIGLNPSTADAETDDNTIRKCIKFAKSWGYEGLIMTNLFAYRATKPKVMMAYSEPVGAENDWHLEQQAGRADTVIAAWGADGWYQGRAGFILDFLPPDIYALRVSEKTGQPWHPLYLPDNTKPFLFRAAKNRLQV